MFDQEAQNQNRRRRPVCFLLLVAMIIILPIQSIVEAQKTESTSEGILQRLKNQTEVAPQSLSADLPEILSVLENAQYDGKWNSTVADIAQQKKKNPLLEKTEGRLKVSFRKLYVNTNIVYGIVMHIFSNQYSDDGYMTLALTPTVYNASEAYSKGQYIVTLNKPIDLNYDYSIKLNNILSSRSIQYRYIAMNVTNLTFSFSLTQDKKNLLYAFNIQSDQLNIEAENVAHVSTIVPNVLLALVLTLSSTLHLLAIIRIFNRVLLGQQSAEKYSLVSFVLLTVWDLTITVLSFVLCFENERFFIIYLAPTFLASILFSIFEARLIMIIFNTEHEATQSNNFRFNILIYVVFILSYYLIDYTNLANSFFLILPAIILPQIYKNAYRGQQITFDTNYICLYAPRFLILLYLRGYSKNIFDLEPSYSFCISLIILVISMIGVLYVQARYGTRVLFPKFMLPKRYEYFEEEELVSALEAGISSEDCAICLTPVHVRPQNEQNLQGEYVGKIMKTPCGHRFHGTCLVPWMQHKMDCPTCRTKLPPF